MHIRSAPPCVDDFVRLVAEVAGVQCIVVEDEASEAIHITTFAAPITDENRAAVYNAECEIVEANPELRFDFHLRRADEVVGKPSSPVSGKHLYAVWGDMNANDG